MEQEKVKFVLRDTGRRMDGTGDSKVCTEIREEGWMEEYEVNWS